MPRGSTKAHSDSPPETLAANIVRVCAPGAKISLYGIEPLFTDRPFGRLIWKLLEESWTFALTW